MKALLIFLLTISYLFANDTKDFRTLYLNEEQRNFLEKHPVIKVSNEKNWPPYDYFEDGFAKGYAIDYIKLIAKKLGIEVEFHTDSWENLLEKAKNKEIDLIHPILINEDRKKYLNFTQAFLYNKRVLVTREDENSIRTLDDLKGKTLVLGKDWSITKYIKKNFKDINVLEVKSSKEMVEAVVFGEADATIDNDLTVNYLRKKYILGNLKIVNKIHFPELDDKGLHFAARKDWKILSDIFTVAIKNISEEELNSLNKKWNDVENRKVLLTKNEEEFLQNNPVIKIRASQKYYPFSFTQEGTEKGYVVDYTNLIAKKLGIEIEYIKGQSWGEAIEDFKNKKLDVLPMMKITEDRKAYANFTSPILETYVGIATLKENLESTSLLSLENKKVAIMKGYWWLDNLKKQYPKIQTVVYKNNLESLVALKEGKVDAVISTEPVLQYLIKENFFVNIAVKPILNNPFFEKTLGRYAVRKDWKIFTQILEKAMNGLTQNEVRELKTNWFGLSFNNKSVKNEIVYTQDEINYFKKSGKINMCIDPDWYPYEELENGKHIGMSYDYFQVLQKYIPSKIELVESNSWTHTLDFAKKRVCDIISLAVDTPLRREYLSFTKPYLSIPLVVATKLDKPFITNLESVLDYKLAVVKDYFHIEILRKKYPNIKLIEVDSMEEGFNKVIAGDAYGFIDSLTVIGHKIQQKYLGNLKIAGKIEEDFQVGVAVRNDIPELLSIFNKAIDKLDENTHQQILNKWVSVKYEKETSYKLLFQILSIIAVFLALFAYRQILLKRENNKLVKAQKSLEASVGEFESLINSTLEGIFLFKESKCIKANEEAIKLFNYENKEDIEGINIFDLLNNKFHTKVQESFNEEKTVPFEVVGVKKDGENFPILLRSENFVFRSKEIKLVVVMDLTDLKHKEKLLAEQSKMVALGEMLGNIAHQWRQPLSVISTAASGVKLQKEMGNLLDEVFDESMDGIVNNAKYLSKTIDDFRNFIAEDKAKIEFDIQEYIQKDLSILKPMLKLNQIEIITDFEKNLRVLGVPNELSQVMINIVTNSKDKFLEVNCENRYIFIKTFKKDNNIFISIKDNATGIAEDIIDKIFEPYFTTKHKNQGTGLGLYMTNQIVTQSFHGYMEVNNVIFNYNNKKQRGAQFTICIKKAF